MPSTHTTQFNALLNVMADMILHQITDEVSMSQYFGLICDETKDLSKAEQLSVVLRYVHDGLIHEEFIGMTCAESVNAESLATYITEKTEKSWSGHQSVCRPVI